MKKLSEMTDEERYGKVGAEIRRLDPEAYKNRPKTAEGNLKLLRELRAKAKSSTDSRPEPTVNFMREGRKKADDTPTEAMRDEARKDVSKRKNPVRRTVTPFPGSAALTRSENKRSENKKSEDEKSEPSRMSREEYRSLNIRPRRTVTSFPGSRYLTKQENYKKGGSVKSSASRRADGCAKKGKTRGKIV